MKENNVSLTCPMILMRTGGLDGVALQAREYRYLLNKLHIKVIETTGRFEFAHGPLDPIGHKQKIIRRLDFYHRDSQLLFANQFTHGSEKDGIVEISDQEWIDLFIDHKNKIKRQLDKLISSIPHNTPVFVFNLLALRHAHPAAAAALYELMVKYPDRGFISHSADPDAERPEKICRIKEHILPYISADYMSDNYDGGPYNLKNLYHIVLNPTQKGNFIERYNIPRRHIFEIPDFLEFRSKKPMVNDQPGVIFMDYLADSALQSFEDSYSYKRRPVRRNTIFFLSPVRPVYRKRLKESMLIAQQYGKASGRDVAFVVTHPNKDDMTYFMETIKFAEALDLPYYHLGERFSLQTLDNVYDNFAPLPAVGVVSSNAGGWENALNEMARECIPFYMNKELNSYVPLTERIGMQLLGTDFTDITDIIKSTNPDKLKNMNFSNHPEFQKAFQWFDLLNIPEEKKKITKHNFRKAYNYLSHKATKPRLEKAILNIYKKHGISDEVQEFFDKTDEK